MFAHCHMLQKRLLNPNEATFEGAGFIHDASVANDACAREPRNTEEGVVSAERVCQITATLLLSYSRAFFNMRSVDISHSSGCA